MVPALFYEFAVPDDKELDSFDSGEQEVDDYFINREWFKGGRASPPTYVFRTEDGGQVVGYAAVSFCNVIPPNSQSMVKAKYLTIFVCGVNKQFQGKRNPRSPQENFAASIFAILEDFAAKKASCEGLKLWVRTSNSRAIRFYEKFGFFQDTSGPVQEAKEGSPHLTMWKPLGS